MHGEITDRAWQKDSHERGEQQLLTIQNEIRWGLSQLRDVIKKAPDALPNKELLAEVMMIIAYSMASEQPGFYASEAARKNFIAGISQILRPMGYVVTRQSSEHKDHLS